LSIHHLLLLKNQPFTMSLSPHHQGITRLNHHEKSLNRCARGAGRSLSKWEKCHPYGWMTPLVVEPPTPLKNHGVSEFVSWDDDMTPTVSG
jgi:hypothetical protein